MDLTFLNAMWLRNEEFEALLTEWKEICAHLRERRRTIWQVRSFYLLAITAFVAYISARPLSFPYVSVFLTLTGLLMLVLDVKYQRAKILFEKAAREIEEKTGILTLYSKKRRRTILPPWLQVIVIYLLWFTGLTIWFLTLLI